MKKLLLFAAFAAFTFTTANAQSEFRIGFKGGVNFSSVGGDFTDDYDGRTSFHIGGLVEIPISEKFAVQPELLYSSQGAKSEYDNSFGDSLVIGKEKLKLDYINIPIMAKYYIIEGLSVEAGPQFGILVSAKNEYEESGFRGDESGEDDVKDFYNTLDIGFGFGSSYRLNNGVFFSARYVIGFTDITDDEGFDFGPLDIDGYKQRNGVLQLSAGFSF
ncbi:MAG: porin family protein [Aequorivita antarctica]